MSQERPAEEDPAGPDPAGEVSPIGKWMVFLLCAAATVVLVALVCFAISLPTCEHPPNSWAPCIGP
ncbi:hypothetical protein [Citricoccus sp. K5]|uniref:hypothetical protein n=1 Tax=Citricoccus sp. K5 TaxID=2653135 RepID=UPI0012F22EF0|nr:hypothetical protein [Citricoccus sp. K5]VXB68561.1 conserved hypothetical protein [Citricoccus sp. K5]